MGHNYAHAHLLCIIVQQVCCPTTRVPLAERRPTYPTPSDATGSTTAPLRSPMTGWPEKTWTGGTLWRRSAPTQVCSLCLPAAASTTRTWTAALADSSSIHVSPSSAFLLIQTHERFERTLFISTRQFYFLSRGKWVRVGTESWPWRNEFPRLSFCQDLNPRPFDHEFGALTSELSLLVVQKGLSSRCQITWLKKMARRCNYWTGGVWKLGGLYDVKWYHVNMRCVYPICLDGWTFWREKKNDRIYYKNIILYIKNTQCPERLQFAHGPTTTTSFKKYIILVSKHGA